MDGGAAVLRELARYCAAETERWREWFVGQEPSVLWVAVGEPPVATAGALLAHIAGVEWIYALSLEGAEVPAFEGWWPPSDSPARSFGLHDEAFSRLLSYLESADGEVLAREHALRAPGVTLYAPGGKLVAHMLVHGIRHWAQLASALRRSGHATPWQHDLIACEGFGPPAVFLKQD